ncbi:probable global transcription activator SNF2L2 [Sycon ciliatum]|uniref:probable global transcription activator SNF2L2 n=1 Tax=Sycon ciliatum TaxID=27933 RepID=UPI0031F69F4C
MSYPHANKMLANNASSRPSPSGMADETLQSQQSDPSGQVAAVAASAAASAPSNHLSEEQQQQLKAQIVAFRYLSSNKGVPAHVLSVAQCENKISRTTVPRPVGVDPAKVLRERELRIAGRIQSRVEQLNQIPIAGLREDIATQAQIELRALRLVDLQRQVRRSVLEACRQESILASVLNPKLYKCVKKQSLREARSTEKLEKQQKEEKFRKERQKHLDFLHSVIEHGKEFREYHRQNQVRTAKVAKNVMLHHANTEREQKRETERLEKERIRRLMAEDEEGYRTLVAQQKDSRLMYLLNQTDDFIGQLTQLVREHKKTGSGATGRIRRKSQLDTAPTDASGDAASAAAAAGAAEAADKRVPVRRKDTGEVVDDENAPRQSELAAFLESHPSYEAVPSDALERTDSTESSQPGDQDDKPENAASDNDGSDMDEGDEDKASKDDDDSQDKTATAETEEGEDAPGAEESAKATTDKAAGDEDSQTAKKKKRKINIRKDRAVDEEDEYQCDENKTYYSMAHNRREAVTKQPDLLQFGTLKTYQVAGLEWLVSLHINNLNGILADEMGLGKTIQTISLITYLIEKKNYFGPFLIIVPLSTLSNWVIEFERWAPSVPKLIYKGSPNVRRSIANQLRSTTFAVLLTTYEYVMKDRAVLGKVKWEYLIIDEGHRMKNHHCKLTQILNQFYASAHRLILTGTPLQNNLPEMWAILNFLLPTIFKSVTTFEQWFNAPFAMTTEKMELNEEETILIIRRLHKVLRPFLLRRLKKEVESQLPSKTEYVIRCEMSSLQRRIYRHMQKRGVLLTDGSENNKKGKGGTRSLQNTIVQLRKICNHPFMFQQMEEAYSEHIGSQTNFIEGPDLFRASGKFELLDRVFPKLKKAGHKVLLFCQMTSCMTILEDYLAWRGWRYLRLDGTTKSEDRGHMLRLFNDKDSPFFVFLLSTRAGGLGLNLQSADTVVIFDSDWNPHQDLQAQDRAHRIGQVNEVRVLRLLTVNSVEEKILAVARYKLDIDDKVIQAGMFDQKSTGQERRNFLEALLYEDEEDKEEEEVPDDETVNHMIARGQPEFEMYQRMDNERNNLEKTDEFWIGKSRLIEDGELPEWLLKDEEEVERLTAEEEEDKLFGRGVRQRADVDYTDHLTEKQWMKAIEDGTLDEVKEKRRRSGKPSSANSSLQVSEAEDDDSDGEPRKKRKRTSTGRNKPTPSPEMSPVSAELSKQMNSLMELIQNYEDDDHNLGGIFYQLPSRQKLPDYYRSIKNPMDIKRIRERITSNRYRSLDQLQDDVLIMFSNARDYNIEGSPVYNDSLTLQAVFMKACADVMEESVSPAPSKGSSSSQQCPLAAPGGLQPLKKRRGRPLKNPAKIKALQEEQMRLAAGDS